MQNVAICHTTSISLCALPIGTICHTTSIALCAVLLHDLVLCRKAVAQLLYLMQCHKPSVAGFTDYTLLGAAYTV